MKEIDAQRVDGNFVTAEGEIPAGNDIVCDLLNRCLMWADIVLERKGEFPEEFREVCRKLVNIRNQLEKLSLTQAWSLRETDLYDYQRQLDKIDESRVDGNFLDAQGNPAELYVQRVRQIYSWKVFLLTTLRPSSISSDEVMDTSTTSWFRLSQFLKLFCLFTTSFRR